MSTLFRNSSPGALTLEQARAREKQRVAAARAAALQQHARNADDFTFERGGILGGFNPAKARAARKLAAEGRGNDTEIAHVARGEVVVPLALQTPELMAMLSRAAAAHNIPMEMLTVGSAGNRINPTTGAPEFGVMDWLGSVKNKVVNEVAGQVWDGMIKGADYTAKGIRFFNDDFERGKAMHTVLPPGAGDPPQSMPSNETLNYHEDNPNMLRFVAMNPIDSFKAGWHGLRAYQEVRDRYEGGPAEATLHGGEGDAWRHARWNQRMADSFGPEKAKIFADYYEQLMNSNPGDRAMDLYNNQVGRSLVDNRVDNTGKVGDTTIGAIDDLVRAGRLRTRPY